MRTLNVRLAIGLIVGGLVLSGAVYKLNGLQVKWHADVFLKAARRAKEQKKYREARDYYRGYLTLAYGTETATEALQELATLVADQATDVQGAAAALQLFDNLLREDPKRSEARRRMIKIAMSIPTARYYSTAKKHIEVLLRESPQDATLHYQLGRCETGLGENQPARDSFRKSIELAPKQLDAYADLAWLLRERLNLPQEADEYMRKMVRQNSKSDKAHLAYAQYLLGKVGRIADPNQATEQAKLATAEAKEALRLAPDDRNGLFLAAQSELMAGNSKSAGEYVEKGQKLYPSDPAFYLAQADIDMRAGDAKSAVKKLEEGLKATKYHVDILWHLAIQYLEARHLDQARDMIQRLRAAKYPSRKVDFLEARLLLDQEHWVDARDALEKVRPDLTGLPDLQKQVDYFIGCCYHQMSNQDRELEAYRRAVAIDPLFILARRRIAEVYLATGKLNDAIDEYQEVVRSGRAGAGAVIKLAHLLLMKNLSMSEANRDWYPVEQMLKRAAEVAPMPLQVPLLKAEVLANQNHADVAEQMLEKWRDKNKERPEFWIALASLAERQREWDKAETLLNDAQQSTGDKVVLRLARAQYLVERYRNDAAARLRKLAEDTERFSETERIQLWNGLIIWSLQANDDQQTRRLIERVADKVPAEIRGQLLRLRFEMALRAKDVGAIETTLAEIEKATGRNPIWLYGKATSLILQAEKKGEKGAEGKALLSEAQTYLTAAREQYPTWSRPVLAAAAIDDLLGNREAALKGYLDAIRLGDRNPEAVCQAVRHLNQQRRYHEANDIMVEMDERQTPVNQVLVPLALEDATRVRDYNRVYKLAEDPVMVESKNWREQMLRGQTLSILGRHEWSEGREHIPLAESRFGEAEKAFRRAIELNDKAPEAWVSLVQFFTALHQFKHARNAEEVVAQARAHLAAKEAHPALAEMYEALGGCYDYLAKASEAAAAAATLAKDQKRAREAAADAVKYKAHTEKDKEHAQKEYEAALADAADDPEIIRMVAFFYLRVPNLKAAVPLLEKLVDPKTKATPADLVWGRRQLALIVAAQGGYANLQAALKMIEANLTGGELAVEDLRAKATFQALDPRRATRLKATETMEQLLRREEASLTEDRYTVAQVYLALGNMNKFREHMRVLLAKEPPDLRFVATYISAELEHNELGEAEIWIGTLERLRPYAFGTARFRADDLVRRNHPDRALKVLEKFVEQSNVSEEEVLSGQRLVAETLEQLADRLSEAHQAEQTAAAERFLKKAELLWGLYVDQRPQDVMLLAGFLARRERVREALDLMEKKWADCDPDTVAQALEALVRNGIAAPEQNAQIERILQGALKQFGRPKSLVLVFANIATQQKRYAEAEKCYREVIGKDANNGAALNNLAMLFVAQGARLEEGLRVINTTIDYWPSTSKLDTRAILYLANNEPQKALGDMNVVLGDSETPTYLFHLARIYYQMGQKSEAAQTLARARKAGLKESELGLYERPLYEKLRDVLR